MNWFPKLISSVEHRAVEHPKYLSKLLNGAARRGLYITWLRRSRATRAAANTRPVESTTQVERRAIRFVMSPPCRNDVLARDQLCNCGHECLLYDHHGLVRVTRVRWPA